jgi:hypothetical protein
MLVSDWFRKFYNYPIIQTHTRLLRSGTQIKDRHKKNLSAHLNCFFSIMIRFTCSLVLFALITIVYSTDYFVEKFEGKYYFHLIEFYSFDFL